VVTASRGYATCRKAAELGCGNATTSSAGLVDTLRAGEPSVNGSPAPKNGLRQERREEVVRLLSSRVFTLVA
jgi:hypothetical protein